MKVKKIIQKAILGLTALLLPLQICQAEEPIPAYPNLKVDGIVVTADNAHDILNNGTVFYDLESNTLTLNHSNIHTEIGNYGIRAEGDINIELIGENHIESEDYYGMALVDPANANSINVTIFGDGTLETRGTISGMWVKGGSLTVKGNATLISEAPNPVAGNGNAYGLRTNHDLTICDNAKVIAKSGISYDNTSFGLHVGNNLTISGNGTAEAQSGAAPERTCGTYVMNTIIMEENGTLLTTGADNSGSTNFASESYGIRTTYMKINGGSLQATGQGATGYSGGIYTQTLDITDGEVKCISVDPKTAQSVGLQVTTKLVITGGELHTIAGDTSADSWGIDASTSMDISGGKVNVKTGTGDRTWGISTESLIISGGELNIHAAQADSQSRGIRATNTLRIQDGTVTVVAGDANDVSYGLMTSGTFEIFGGTLNVTAGTAERSQAVRASSGVVIGDALEVLEGILDGEHATIGEPKEEIDTSDDNTDKIPSDNDNDSDTTDDDKPVAAKTGDTNTIWLYIALMTGCILVFTAQKRKLD